MACYRPLQAFRTASGDVTFDRRAGDTELTLPCGACIGCRLARARAWSLRCVHEASLHKANCFVTLTYSEENIPVGGSLNYRDFQLFMKRLRKRTGVKVRFFVCGEYGEKLSRPHYHACLFGYDFPDKVRVSYLATSYPTWKSKLLADLWGHGHTHLGSLNVSSAAYAARYCLKKVTGSQAKSYYTRVDEDGVVHELVPEFARMSLKPGVGALWFEKFNRDVVRGDFVVHDNRKFGVPKYYDRLLERLNPEQYASMKEEREIRSLPFRPDGSPERLAVRETVEAARIATLKRSLHD